MTQPTPTRNPSTPPPGPPFALGGKVAVVTGAGSGIGRSVAMLLARQGARVFVLDVDASGAADTVAQIAGAAGAVGVVGVVGAAGFIECDVASGPAVARAFGEIERLGRLDILVNNAGIAHIGNLESTSEAELDRVYSVNVKGVFHCLRAAVPLMASYDPSLVLSKARVEYRSLNEIRQRPSLVRLRCLAPELPFAMMKANDRQSPIIRRVNHAGRSRAARS